MAGLLVNQVPLPAAQWNAFFSHLAVAENSAAQQFALIAKGLLAQGHLEAARRYQELAREEVEHYERVSRTCHEFIPPPAGVLELYSGGLADASTPLVERMAVAHFSHETAALAFLGHLHGHIHELMTDVEWAKQVRHLCAGILREEVQHVKHGRVFVAHFLLGQSEAVRTQVRSAVRLHRDFVIRIVRRVFRGHGVGPFVDAMMGSYKRHCRAATGDVLGIAL